MNRKANITPQLKVDIRIEVLQALLRKTLL